MQSQNRFFDDAAKIFGGTANVLIGLRREIEAVIQQQFERFLGSMDLVTRDEFEAVRQMAAKARSEQEDLNARIERMEKNFKVKKTSKRPKVNGRTASGKKAKGRVTGK